MNTIEEVLFAITLFSLFMSMPILLLVGMPYRAPYWYRLARVTCRLYVRAWQRTVL